MNTCIQPLQQSYAHWMYYAFRMMLYPSGRTCGPWAWSWKKNVSFANGNIPVVPAKRWESPHRSHLSNQIKTGFVKTLGYPPIKHGWQRKMDHKINDFPSYFNLHNLFGDVPAMDDLFGYPGCSQLAECELVDDYREERLLQAWCT